MRGLAWLIHEILVLPGQASDIESEAQEEDHCALFGRDSVVKEMLYKNYREGYY